MNRTKQSVQRELENHYANLNQIQEKIAAYTELEAPVRLLNQRSQISRKIAELEDLLASGELPDENNLPGESGLGGGSGGLKIGGDYVGGNKIGQQGDIIYGDKVGGDKVGGHKIEVGNISNSSNFTLGDRVQPGVDAEALFQTIYKRIEARSEDPDVDKAEIVERVEKIEQEASKGESANPKKVGRWLNNLAQMAPDILEVTIAALTNPAAGAATVIRKVAEKAKQDAGQA